MWVLPIYIFINLTPLPPPPRQVLIGSDESRAAMTQYVDSLVRLRLLSATALAELSDDPTEAAARLVLDVLLTRPVNHAFLAQHMRVLSLEQVLVLLQHLLRWHAMHFKYGGAPLPEHELQHYLRTPSHFQVIEWLCTLLETHSVQLLLTDDGADLLRMLARLTGVHVTVCDRANRIQLLVQAMLATARAGGHGGASHGGNAGGVNAPAEYSVAKVTL